MSIKICIQHHYIDAIIPSRTGRKATTLYPMLAAGICCIAVSLISKSKQQRISFVLKPPLVLKTIMLGHMETNRIILFQGNDEWKKFTLCHVDNLVLLIIGCILLVYFGQFDR